MVSSLRLSRDRGEIVSLLVVIAAMVVLFLPVVSRAVNESADYGDHIRDARLWSEAGIGLDTAIRPHFLYHLLLILAYGVAPAAGWNGAAVVVGVALYALLGVVVEGMVRPVLAAYFQPAWAFTGSLLLTVGLLLVAPVTLLTLSQHNLYLGYIAIHTYHNPTQVVLKPLALLFFVYTLRLLGEAPPTRMVTGVTFALGLLSSLAKPSYAICIIPAVGLLAGYRLLRRQRVHWAALIVGFAAPLALVLAWQYLFHRTGEGGFGFEPFQVMEYYSPGTWPVKFVASILFPAFVTAAYFSQARSDQPLLLAWLAFAVGTAYTYFLIEPSNWTSGNFLWSGQITLFILFIVATLFFARQVGGLPFRQWGWCGYAGAGIWLLHLISGIVWYGVQISEGIYAWW